MNRRTQEITTEIDKKYWTGWINKYENRKKINRMTGISRSPSIITLNINSFNYLIQKHRLANWNRKQDLYFSLF